MTSLPVRADITVTGTRWANSNGSRGHHYAHQKLMNTWRDLATIAASGQGPVDAPVVITATVRRTRNARQDAHNVFPSVKACIDGAVKAGVIEDDHDGIVKALVIQAGPKASKPTIELTIEAA